MTVNASVAAAILWALRDASPLPGDQADAEIAGLTSGILLAQQRPDLAELVVSAWRSQAAPLVPQLDPSGKLLVDEIAATIEIAVRRATAAQN